MQRIEDLLKETEVPIWACSLGRDTSIEAAQQEKEIGFRKAMFEWDSKRVESEGPSRFRLGALNLVFPEDRLTIVSGATGSGKSALLGALLGGKSDSLCSAALADLFRIRNELHIRRGAHRQIKPPGCVLCTDTMYGLHVLYGSSFSLIIPTQG